jgi:hypothetical protein
MAARKSKLPPASGYKGPFMTREKSTSTKEHVRYVIKPIASI